jgi:quercetin dioxygenase-like cupin family protein
MFISVAAPNVKVPEHTHNEGAGLRFIASGSITYKDTELNAGDWMYIPKGAKYSFQVGALGATMFYCYHC